MFYEKVLHSTWSHLLELKMFYVDHDLGTYVAKDYKKYLEKNVKFSGMEIGQSKEDFKRIRIFIPKV